MEQNQKEKREKIIEKLEGWFNKLELSSEEVFIILNLMQKQYLEMLDFEDEAPEPEEDDLDFEEEQDFEEPQQKERTAKPQSKVDRVKQMKEALRKQPTKKVNVRGKGNTPNQSEIDDGAF